MAKRPGHQPCAMKSNEGMLPQLFAADEKTAFLFIFLFQCPKINVSISEYFSV